MSTVDRSLSVIFIGNSYTFREGMPLTVQRILYAATPLAEVRVTVCVKGSTDLESHYGKSEARAVIRANPSSVVVLQERGLGALEAPQSMETYLGRFADDIRKVNSVPMLYITPIHESRRSEQDALSSIALSCCRKHDVIPVPVGAAFQEFEAACGNTVPLRTPDGFHPGPVGATLAAATIARSIARIRRAEWDEARAASTTASHLASYGLGAELSDLIHHCARSAHHGTGSA